MRHPVTLLAAALVLAGCGGRLAPTIPPGSARPTSSGAVMSSAPSSAPTAPTAPPTAAVAGCPAGSITADGAPFCYALPAGFRDFSTRPDYGYGWQWRTLVSAGAHDLIEVVAQPVRTRLAALDAAGKRRFVDQLRLRPDVLHVISAGPLTAITVAGATAYAQDATYRLDPSTPPFSTPPSSAPRSSAPPSSAPSSPPADPVVTVHSVAVLASAAIVYVSCQATAARAASVAAACRAVEASLRVV